MSHVSPARVYLVGAGPGDPGLLTLRGAECLARADLVLYDYLVNPQLLELAPPHAERICLGRHGRDRIWTQEEINRCMTAAALAGRTVVRLKGGDPAIFARVHEELECLAAHGIPYEVVPGITAALAAGSYAGVPLTQRDAASAIALLAGHEYSDKEGAALDYGRLAPFPGTLVVYMGVTEALRWTQALIAGGKPPHTPAAIVRRCSWPDQLVVRTTLAEVPHVLAERHIRPPVLVIVGEVVQLAAAQTWFTSRPLVGRAILVSRPAGQADPLRRQLQELGARVWLQPAIEIGPPPDWAPVDAALSRLHAFDWLVFSSANGVCWLLDRLLQTADLRQLGHVKLAAMGPGTAQALARYHLRADLVPDEFRAEALAEQLAPLCGGRHVLLARASRGREVLAETLRNAGAEVEQVVVYTSRDVERPDADVEAALAGGQIHWVTVTSSSIAQALVRLFGKKLAKARVASISPVTSETLRGLGIEPAAEARTYTMEGVVEAIVAAERSAGCL
ncbi:MAG: uroporphyrinogen-III C-methyltransferase [Pirellulales bacterium]|nr:uroporphyrinogen-III C-methyltransferase [Pirellulales bacterium]